MAMTGVECIGQDQAGACATAWAATWASDPPIGTILAATIPLALVSLGFVIYCLVDISRSRVRHLPKWAWALICLLSVPLGGIIYLIVGREER